VNVAEVLVLTAVPGLALVTIVRVSLGYWALPIVGRQPFLIVFAASWALTAVAYLLVELAPRSGMGVLVILILGANAVVVALRGREISKAGGRDPAGGLRPWLVVGHGLFILFVLGLIVTRQI
jgi:hypothetical protein